MASTTILTIFILLISICSYAFTKPITQGLEGYGGYSGYSGGSNGNNEYEQRRGHGSTAREDAREHAFGNDISNFDINISGLGKIGNVKWVHDSDKTKESTKITSVSYW